MKWMSLNDVRETYLSFFETKGHLRLPSFPLIPRGDKSLLLINSGMAPMKKYFTGEETPPRRRVTTCQKCIRTPDLDRVGHTARHGTFFEMLGNFSFGDYFKIEAITWSWEFLTSPDWLDIPAERLWPSVYEGDEEAYALWRDTVGVPEERIVRLGKEDNFWEHGSGPCGPCSEIYFDRGEKYGCGSPDCKPGCDCDRYMEIWNNVFSQFENDGAGHYTELKQKNIDTGMGLERLACVLQGVDNMFEVDTNRAILDTVCRIADKTYGADKQADVSIRVCTDHIKSAMFMIADGVIPGNEGRGYVLRRIIRRACRHGKLLGVDRPFLCDLLTVAIENNARAYPELKEKETYLRRVLEREEERFDATIDAGLSMLAELLDETESKGKKIVDGAAVFKLYDPYGFPFDLTRELIEERGLVADEATFAEKMDEQRARARAARGSVGGWDDTSRTLLKDMDKTEFLGYTETTCTATVTALFVDGAPVDVISEGEGTAVFDRTVFYGESGGQVGDVGTLSADGFSAAVSEVKKADGVFLHPIRVEEGALRLGDTVTLSIDTERRDAIRRNHSACHLLQAALRRVLGTHVEQAGSYVDEHRVRFDFSHFAALTDEELAQVAELVNREILAALPVTTTVTDLDSARKAGAMALFGEKYGDSVRMVKMGDVSTELCGGTHVSTTGAIGLFVILSETSVAAGVRRIEGTTGLGVLARLSEEQDLLAHCARELKAQTPADLPHRIEQIKAEIKDQKRDLDAAQARLSEAEAAALAGSAVPCGKVRLLTKQLKATADEARRLCDTLKARCADLVVVLAAVDGERLNFAVCCGPDAVRAGAHAGNLLREVAAVTGGKGGGRPDSAMGAGREIDRIPAAFAAAESILRAL
ncbi:MAG: alanine--tRNA ligase [Clostridia bacterium]|nr:alanine--tRNA ligase [Clostridia bacterium]